MVCACQSRVRFRASAEREALRTAIASFIGWGVCAGNLIVPVPKTPTWVLTKALNLQDTTKKARTGDQEKVSVLVKSACNAHLRPPQSRRCCRR